VGAGLITRIVVAESAGHGASVAGFVVIDDRCGDKNINQKSQKVLGETQPAVGPKWRKCGGFATALCSPYLASTERLSVATPATPNPFFTWAIDQQCSCSLAKGREPRRRRQLAACGLDAATAYQTFDVTLGPGDWPFFYTDA